MLSRLLVVVIMFRAAVEVREQVISDHFTLSVGMLVLTCGICIGTHLLALVLGMMSGRLLGMDRGSQVAVGFAGSQKTLPVSLYLFEMYFQAYPLAVVPMAFYHVGQLVVDTFIADALAPRAAETPAPAKPDLVLDSEGTLP